MAQELPPGFVLDEAPQRVPLAQIRPIIAAPRDPNEAAQNARAEIGTQLNVQGEERAGRKEQFDYAKELRTAFNKAPEATNYETVIRQFSSALGAKSTPTGDQALITAYAKMLDPASVVREAEFNIVQAGDSAIGRQVARIQRELGIDSSGLLRPEVRNRVLTEMRNLVDNYRLSYDRVRGDYERLAGTYNINPESVVLSRIDDPYLPKIEKAWQERGVSEEGAQQLGLEAGATFSTEQDKAIRDATQQAWQSGADLQGIVAAAQAAGGKITPNDIANIQAAIEARAKGQSVTFNPAQTGQRSPVAQAAGEFLMTPAGTALTGAANAASVGLLSQVAGDQVQGLEALNPNAALVGELAGSIAGTAGLARGGAAALRMAAPGIAERVAGGGLAGAIGREALTESAYGGLYAANTGQDIGTGLALGAAGSLGGRALGAAARRVAPAVGRVLGREGGNVPPDGGVPPGGADMGGGVPPAGGQPAVGPITNNRLYSEKIGGPEFRFGDALPKYGMRNIFSNSELQDIINSGFVRPRSEGGSKYFTMSDLEAPKPGNQEGKVIRIRSENIPNGTAARAEDVQIWNNQTKSWDDLVPKAPAGAPSAGAPMAGAPADEVLAAGQALTPEASAEVGTIIRDAVGTGKKANVAQIKLAEMAQVDPEAMDAAQRLGLEIPADVFSDSPQVRAAVGLTRSLAGSEAEASWRNTVSAAVDTADNVMRNFDAQFVEGAVSPGVVSQRVKESLTTTRAALNKQAGDIYEQVDQAVPKNSPINLSNLAATLGQIKQEVGLGGMTAQERNLSRLLNGKEKVTYGRLIREKNLIGKALSKQESPYGSMDEATLKRLYAALATDQLDNVGAIAGDEMRKQLRGANLIYAKERALAKRIVNAFGNDLEGGIAGKMRAAITGAAKGEPGEFTRLMKAVPDDLRREVVATALTAATRSGRGAERGGFGFSEFADLYPKLRANPPVYKQIVDALGKDAAGTLRDLWVVSKRITEARANVLTTGKANQAMLGSMNAEGVLGRIMDSTAAKRTVGAAMGALGPVAGAVMPDIMAAMTKGKPDAVRAAGKLFISPEFQEMLTRAAVRPGAKERAISKVVRSKSFLDFGKTIGLDPKESKGWLRSIIDNKE